MRGVKGLSDKNNGAYTVGLCSLPQSCLVVLAYATPTTPALRACLSLHRQNVSSYPDQLELLRLYQGLQPAFKFSSYSCEQGSKLLHPIPAVKQSCQSVNLFEICDLFSGHFILLHCGAKEKLLAVQEKMTKSVTFSFSRRGLRQNEEIISRINSAAVDRKETLRCNCWSRKVILNFLKIKGVIVFLILFQSQQCFVPPQGWGRIYIFFSPKRVLIRRCSLYLQPHSSDVLCNRLFI